MKNIIYILFGLNCFVEGLAQSNLVNNPSFEENPWKLHHLGHDSSTGSKELRYPGYLTSYWYSPLKKRSPHIHKSPNKSIAKSNSGLSAIGLILGGQKQKKTKYEYITGQLSKPLVKDQTYCVSFSLLLHRSSNWAASNIGLILHHDNNLIANVSDIEKLEASLYANEGEYITNTKWQRYNGYYTASGGEKYISFGAFGDRTSVKIKELGLEPYFQLDGFQSKAYYQLDDVSVIAKNDSLDCGCAKPLEEKKEILKKERALKPYLFVLDVSGSMRKNGVFDSLRTNLIELLEKLPLQTPVTFTTFSSKSKLIFSEKVNLNTSREVDDLLSKVKLGGGTNVFSGLSEASRSWDVETRDSAQTILISDGSFTVTQKINDIVKSEFENKGRQLKVIQIESKAKNIDRLQPYQTSLINVAPSELRSAVFQIYEISSLGAVSCGCTDEYSDTMNYHFVIDYSGSMKLYKWRAVKVMKYLFDKVPQTSFISIIAFGSRTDTLYWGKKSELTIRPEDQSRVLNNLLQDQPARGGSNILRGVREGLWFANYMSKNPKRFSHLIVITDLDKYFYKSVQPDIQRHSNTIDLAASFITIDLNISTDALFSLSLMKNYTQFDATSGTFREVSRIKFEKDLFESIRSSCDYTTQPYHYNPSKDLAKKKAMKILKFAWKEFQKTW